MRSLKDKKVGEKLCKTCFTPSIYTNKPDIYNSTNYVPFCYKPTGLDYNYGFCPDKHMWYRDSKRCLPRTNCTNPKNDIFNKGK